jgi:hypothetical protein
LVVVIGVPRQVLDTPSHPFDDHRNAMARRAALFRAEQAGQDGKPAAGLGVSGML